MKRKRNLILAFVLLFAVAVTGSIVAGTFAKYTSKVDAGSDSATVAKWAFDKDNESAAIEFDLAKTYDATTLVSGKIAPGTQGSISIDVSNANSEVGVQYNIALDKTNVPTNVKFYSDEGCTTELTDATLTGTLAPKAAAKTVTVYWKWAYETKADDNTVTAGDTADTTDGTNAKAMTVTANITGTQVAPTATN